MATITDSKSNFARSAVAYPPTNMHYGGQFPTPNKGSQGYAMPAHADVAAITQSFQGMSMQSPSFGSQGKSGSPYGGIHTQNAMQYGATPVPYMFPGSYNAPPAHAMGMYTPHAQHYLAHVGYHGYQQHENSPLSNSWTPTTATGDLPTLITPRRDSISSNENDQPTTPAGGYGYAYPVHGGVAIHRSPSGYHHSSSSPTTLSIGSPYSVQIAKMQEHSDLSPKLKMLLSQEPAIPPAIPAPSSPLKPLDRALENQRGETNVYIRGLQPETTDEMLHAYGSRFGDVKSSKSIIDIQTGLCKGFGFVKYHNYEDAENCIRGFHYLGYEVSFARESFYSKLKTFADETNTNLYVSNLPKSMNEHELAQLFTPHKVCSSRILRDKSGNGRGVGFARFESREVCEEVIKTFSNHTINSGGEELQIQIRYADTQEQKSLKQQTQAARQFRSAEYEYATQAWRQNRLSPFAGNNAQDTPRGNGNDFDRYLGSTAAVPIENQRWAQSVLRPLHGRSPLHINSSSPSTPGQVATSREAPTVEGKVETATGVPLSSKAATEPGSPVDSVHPKAAVN